jgi:amylosucrase
MIAVRKELSGFADFDNRQLLTLDNPQLLAFARTDSHRNTILVLGNFHDEPQTLSIDTLNRHGFFQQGQMTDKYSGQRIYSHDKTLAVPALSCYWLSH